MMRVVDILDVVEGDAYLVVCNDSIIRYLVAEFNLIGLEGDILLKELVFIDMHGSEQYRTANPELIFDIGVNN